VKRPLFAGILSVLAFSAFAQQFPQPPQHKQITIRSVAMGEMGATLAAPQGLQWSPDSTKVAYIQPGQAGEGQALYYFDPATGKSAVLVAADKLGALKPPTPTKTQDDREKDNRARYGVAAYHWSPDSKSLLFDTMGHLWLYNLESGAGTQLTAVEETNTDPKFSPDANYITFIRNHNLFLRATGQGTEQQLTEGTDKNILNGEVDWLYEEELNVRSNYFWSPDSKQILYLQTNQTQVPNYPIVDWMPTHPTTDMIKYPKAGDPNPVVRLGVVGLDGKTKWITPTAETDMYIPRFGWLKPGVAWALVLNRRQNQETLYIIEVATGKSRRVLTETDPDYLELHDGLYFFESGDRFLWPSWRDGHTHLYLYSLAANPLDAEAKLLRQLTKGEWEMLTLDGVDEAAGIVYYSSNEGDDRQQQLYSIKLDGSQTTRLSKTAGSHAVRFADNARYYIDNSSSLTAPLRMSLCSTGGPCNEIFQAPDLAKAYDFIAPQFVDFKAEDGTLLRGVILIPKTGPAMKNEKFPLVMNPYGGPQVSTIRDGFGTIGMFDQYLAKQGIAVLKVDNRGMFNRGRKFATVTYKNLGQIELKDQLAALDQALTRFPQLDATRLGWWGWSYGGSMTLNALTHSNRFKAGVAVAPVSDWHNYDSAYTERYMGLPQENAAGYSKGSFVKAAGNLSGRLLIVHGTSDDNVHMQNTLQFANALISAGKQFDLQLYPQKTHGIGGLQAREHLFTRIVQQFEEAFEK
jgi:dipeptidyl-peptidase-4